MGINIATSRLICRRRRSSSMSGRPPSSLADEWVACCAAAGKRRRWHLAPALGALSSARAQRDWPAARRLRAAAP